ncbi:23049_t:CDS:2 [Rhizophagus irregularis]|nr:23049_t:CDS:2 [Rhizophagus irregularis]
MTILPSESQVSRSSSIIIIETTKTADFLEYNDCGTVVRLDGM